MAIHDVYLDNVFIQWNEVGGQKVVLGIDNEQQKIFNNVAVLNQIPDIATGVAINGMFEIKDNKPITLVSQFKVNYANGFITFHSDLNNTLITISHYAGRGIIYYPSSRIYTRLSEDGKTVEQTYQDMIDSINKYEYTGIYNNSKTYQINQQVYYNGSTYIAISTTLGNLPTDDNYWRIFTAGNNFLGDFNDTAQYYQRDCVQYDKAIYQCISKPPIGELPTNSDYWMQMISLNDIYLDYIDVLKPEILSATANANNARYKEDYSASVEYKVNNIVRYNNSLYICKSNTTGNVPTNTTYWDNATKAFTWQGVYNASTNYKVLDVVSYLGSSYVCIQNSTGNIPTNNTYFNVLALKGEKGATLSPKGAYNNAETYLKDDLVFYTEGAISGVFYAKQTTIGNIPTNTTYWEVFLSGGGNMNTATYDVDNTGVVDDSQKLGGELPSYYGKSSDVGDKTELDTDNKISLVNAINENVSDINTLAGLSGLVEKANKNSFDTLQTSFESHKADNAKFVADYEYQRAAVAGTQIQVPKQSDTTIVKFRLIADLSGGAITISKDGGATNKPLLDIDNAPVTELPKGFVEVVEDAVNFTHAPKGASLKFYEALVESTSYGGVIYTLTQDDEYIYCGGETTQTVWKIRKSDMSKVSESADYGSAIYALTQDNDYIYCGGTAVRRVWKIRKLDMVKVAESIDYGGHIITLTQDDTYIYCGGYTTQTVWKIRKSDMSKVSESASYGGIIRTLTQDDTYIYCGGETTQTVWKIRKSDMSKVSESASYGSVINALTQDNDYIYCGGNPQKVWKIRKSDMTKVSESADYGGTINALTQDNDYIYCGGIAPQTVWKIRKSDMVKAAESISYGGNIYSITSDDNYLYVGGSTRKVYKLNKVAYLYKNLKLVVIGSV